MLIYEKNHKKKCFSSDRHTDGQTDARSNQNYSSEPHKKIQKKNFLRTDRRTTQNYSSESHNINLNL
jgi:hypothetical protein